jgi:hypothetical protein
LPRSRRSSNPSAPPQYLEERLDEAGTAVWHYLIMRESLHMYDHKDALAVYGIPGRVLARVGVVRKAQSQ